MPIQLNVSIVKTRAVVQCCAARLATVYMSRCCLLELPCKARSTAELEWLTRRAKSAPGLLASAGTVLSAPLRLYIKDGYSHCNITYCFMQSHIF